MKSVVGKVKIVLLCPRLSEGEARQLNEALADAQDGEEVMLSLSYTRTTDADARVPGKTYRQLLGTTLDTLIGTVKKVAVGKDGPYVTLDTTISRAPLGPDGKVNPEKVGWTTIKGEGIRAFQVVKNSADLKRKQQAQ